MSGLRRRIHACTALQQRNSLCSQVFVGNECTSRRHELDISYPICNGLVQSWEDMHHVWDHTFDDVLRMGSHARAESRILLTEPPLNPISNRQRLLETMFETYNFAGAQVQIQAVLTLYAQGELFMRPAGGHRKQVEGFETTVD